MRTVGSQGYPVSGSQAAGDVLEDPDPVLYEPEEPGVPGEPLAMRDATAPHDRAQRKHDQAHVVAPADAEPHTQGHRRPAHIPRAARRHGRVHGNADQARRRVGERAGQTVAQSQGVLAMTTVNGRESSSRPDNCRPLFLKCVYNRYYTVYVLLP